MEAEPQEPFDEQLVVRERNAWLFGLAFVPAIVGFAAMMGNRDGAFAVSPFAALSAFAFYYLVTRNPVPRMTGTQVRVEPDTLVVGQLRVPRSGIRHAWLIPLRDGKLLVRVLRHWAPPIDLGVEDREQGRRLLRALGFDASQTVARFRVASRFVAGVASRAAVAVVTIFGLFFASGVLLESEPELWSVVVRLLGLVGVGAGVLATVPANVDVGADGVLITWLGRKRFLPFDELRTAGLSTEGFANNRFVGARLGLASGKSVWIPVGSERLAADRAGALVERIREAMVEHARGSVDTATAVLARRERPLAEWIRELRAIGSGATADLRTAPVDPAHLWRIVESHAADAASRAAAAVALGAQIDDEGKARLRVAVDAVADERLRVAVDAAASGDDDAIEAALADVTHPRDHVH